MTDDKREETHRQPEQQQQGAVPRGDTGGPAGAAKAGHISPQIDDADDKVDKGDQIAQASQQSSGQGSGQT